MGGILCIWNLKKNSNCKQEGTAYNKNKHYKGTPDKNTA